MNVVTKSGTNTFHAAPPTSSSGTSSWPPTRFDNKANDIEKGKFNAPSARLQLRRSDREGQGPLLLEPRVHPACAATTRRSPGCRRRSSSRRAARRRGPSSTPTARASTINGPTLTRGTCPAIVGTGAGAFNSAPRQPAGLRPRARSRCRSTPAAAIRRTTTSWSAASISASAPTRRLYVRYAYQNQETRARHELVEPVRRIRHRDVNKNHNILGSVTHVFSPTFHQPDEVVWNRLFEDQPLNGDAAADALHEPDGSGSSAGLPHRVPGLPAVQLRATPFRSAGRRSCCSSTRIRPGSKASTTSASAGRTCTSPTIARSAPTRTPSRRSTPRRTR